MDEIIDQSTNPVKKCYVELNDANIKDKKRLLNKKSKECGRFQ